MQVCRNSAFEVFVGFSDALRYYLLTGLATFLNEHAFRTLNSDILICLSDIKKPNSEELNNEEKSRVTKHIHFHTRYE